MFQTNLFSWVSPSYFSSALVPVVKPWWRGTNSISAQGFPLPLVPVTWIIDRPNTSSCSVSHPPSTLTQTDERADQLEARAAAVPTEGKAHSGRGWGMDSNGTERT